MKEIKLTNGYVAKVDEDWFDRLSGIRWRALLLRDSSAKPRVYAYNRSIGYMHRIVCACDSGLVCDHVNGDTLDNRKANLRPATASQNCMKSRKRAGTTSAHKGVHFEKWSGKWRARIKFNGSQQSLGRFSSETEAAAAYNTAAVVLHGKFAVLNEVGRG